MRFYFWGLDDSLKTEEQRLVVLTNKISFVLFWVAFFYILFFFSIGESYLGFRVVPFDIWLLFSLFFNRFRFYLLARFSLILCTASSVFYYSCLLGPDSSIQMYNFALLCVSLVLFSPRRQIWYLLSAMFIPLFGYLLLILGNYAWFPRFFLPSIFLTYVNYSISFMVFMTIIFSVLFFYYSLQRVNQELSQAYMDLKTSRSMVEKSSQLAMLSRLSLGVCHEIRTPLTVLRCEAEDIVAEIEDKGAVKEYAESIMGQVDILDDVVKTMLRFGSEDSSMEKVRLNRVLSEFSGLVVRSVEAEGLEVAVDLQEVQETMLDKRGIFQIVMNLVSNSRDALDGSGNIRISCYEGRYSFEEQLVEGVCLEVFDNGPGIPDDVQEHLFDPYYTSKGPGHIGLGLSIVHRICHAHKGLIDIQSQPGETYFRVWFPTRELEEAVT